MASYKQEWEYYEDGYGVVTQRLVVSDTYAGLFTENAEAVSCFDIGSKKEDLDIAAGVYAEDESELLIYYRQNLSATDKTAADFLLAASDKTVRRFVALFFMPITADDIVSLVFSGIVAPDFKSTDGRWYRAEYASIFTADTDWKLRVRSFDTAIMDTVYLSDTTTEEGDEFSGIFDEMLVDEDFMYLSARRPLEYDAAGVIHQSGEIIPLNAFLRRAGEATQEQLKTKLAVPEFTISYASATLDVQLIPAMYEYYASVAEGNPQSVKALVADATKGQNVVLGGADYEEGIWISERLFKKLNKVKNDDASDLKPEEDALSWRRYGTFTKLLFGIAQSLGLFIRMRYVTSAHIEISFLKRSAVGTGQMFLKDAVSAEVSINPVEQETDHEKATGQGTIYSLEGQETYKIVRVEIDVNKFEDRAVQNENLRDLKRGQLLALTISPTMTSQSRGRVVAPHNVSLADTVHTGMYLRTETSVGFAGTVLNPPKVVHRPVMELRGRFSGVNLIITTMADFVNAIVGRDADFYLTEFSVTVPYLCSFRRSADGSHLDDDGGRGRWQNVKLGMKLQLKGIDFVVSGIERSFKDIQTKLKLQAITRFALLGSTVTTGVTTTTVKKGSGIGDTIDGISQTTTTTQKKQAINLFVRGESSLAIGDVAVIRADNLAYRATADADEYHLKRGVVIEYYGSDDTVTVQFAGKVVLPSTVWNLALVPHYIRTATAPASNLSISPLTAKAGSEDLYVEFGFTATPQEFVITNNKIFKYP